MRRIEVGRERCGKEDAFWKEDRCGKGEVRRQLSHVIEAKDRGGRVRRRRIEVGRER